MKSTERPVLFFLLFIASQLVVVNSVFSAIQYIKDDNRCKSPCAPSSVVDVKQGDDNVLEIYGPWVDWARVVIENVSGSGSVNHQILVQNSPTIGQGYLRLRLTPASNSTGERRIYLRRRTGELNPAVPAEIGNFRVRIVSTGTTAGTADTRPEFVIVAIGDSYGAGEGNPEKPGWHHYEGLLPGAPVRPDTVEYWGGDSDSQRCRRSDNSAFAKTARQLQQEFPQVKVVFKSFACSGASIIDSPTVFNAGGQLKLQTSMINVQGKLVLGFPRTGGGALFPYKGAEEKDPPLPPQITQINNWLATRQNKRIDALLMSFSGNDAGFAAIIFQCLVNIIPGCGLNDAARVLFEDGLSKLPSRLDMLGKAIRNEIGPPVRLNVPPSRAYISTYPDPSRDETGALCHAKMPIDARGNDEVLLSLTSTETRWVSNELLPALNGAITSAASRNGWTPVGGLVEDFRIHGICSNQRWINTNRDGLWTQGADVLFIPPAVAISSGFVHPNNSGYNAIARRFSDAVRPQLAAFVQTLRLAERR